METPTFRLSPPAFVTLESPDGSIRVPIDVFKARRILEEASKQPTESARWEFILKWLAGQLGIPSESLAESMALEFNNFISAEVHRIKEQLSKKLGETVFSQQSIPASLPTT